MSDLKRVVHTGKAKGKPSLRLFKISFVPVICNFELFHVLHCPSSSSSPKAPSQPLTSPDRLNDATALYAHAFENDPVIAYMLSTLPTREDRLAYFPAYFHTLMKASSLNGGIFEDIEDPYAPGGSSATEKVPNALKHVKYQCASVMIPPGKRVDNPWTILPSGFFSVLWNIGYSGCSVRTLFVPMDGTFCVAVQAKLEMVLGMGCFATNTASEDAL